MSSYPSAESLLGDARLRADGLPSGSGVLVVEGPDDKRLFVPRVSSATQIVVSGGRRLLLASHDAATESDLAKILFVTDCDYEVGRGLLHPTPSLIVTKNVDSEADFLELGVLHRLVLELVPAALDSDARAREIAAVLLERAVAFAEVISKVRRVALERGVELDLDDIKYSRMRFRGDVHVNEGLFISRLGQKVDHCGISPDDFKQCVSRQPNGFLYCNGHDLVNALQFVLREDYRIMVERTELSRLIRTAVSDLFEGWSVASRIRAWERVTGHSVLQ